MTGFFTPDKLTTEKGEPVFDLDKRAKKKLVQDIARKRHLRMTPEELWQSREEYMKYELDKFRQRIYQEKRRQKFINYLEMKRTEARDKLAEVRRLESEQIKLQAEKKRKKAQKQAKKQKKRKR